MSSPFPPNTICECGCPGLAHRVVWKGPVIPGRPDVFQGTRCAIASHGGHKFQPKLAEGATPPSHPT